MQKITLVLIVATLFSTISLHAFTLKADHTTLSPDSTPPPLLKITFGPNPSEDFIQIFNLNDNRNDAVIFIQDLRGKQIYSAPYMKTNGRVDLHRFDPAIYVLKLWNTKAGYFFVAKLDKLGRKKA